CPGTRSRREGRGVGGYAGRAARVLSAGVQAKSQRNGSRLYHPGAPVVGGLLVSCEAERWADAPAGGGPFRATAGRDGDQGLVASAGVLWAEAGLQVGAARRQPESIPLRATSAARRRGRYSRLFRPARDSPATASDLCRVGTLAVGDAGQSEPTD